ncbi:MAG: tartrate dehydrogenase [Sediminibacterium sp.]
MKYKIAVIPGDGIGLEVIPAAIQLLDKLSGIFGFDLEYQHYDYSCELYKKTGKMMPESGIAQLAQSDAIFLGAVGFPGVPDHISLWGLLIPIRRAFQQYINIRPVRLLEGIVSPLRNPGKIDFLIIRENNEGEYSNVGGKIHEGTPYEAVIQESVFTKMGVDRVMKYAFELAGKRDKKLASATKSNGIIHTMTYWDDRFETIGKEFPHIEQSKFHIDILCAQFVQHPDWFDVVVASNLFGDILSDLGPSVVGGLGIAPGANLNPEKKFPSMFEPVHGSAPDIAGKNIANPIASFWTAQMMLEHLGEQEAANLLMDAIEKTIRAGKVLTRDLGGISSTSEVTEEVLKNLGTNA